VLLGNLHRSLFPYNNLTLRRKNNTNTFEKSKKHSWAYLITHKTLFSLAFDAVEESLDLAGATRVEGYNIQQEKGEIDLGRKCNSGSPVTG
jgi:hypothetical protein